MKSKFLILILSLSLTSCAELQKVAEAVLNATTTGITDGEAKSGLTEALKVGLVTATNLLSEEDGYYGNNLVKIPWPEEAEFVMDIMTSIGMGDKVDKVTKSLNRAAENAAGEALDVFVQSLTQMTFQDALGIVKGGNGAATDYFKRTTTVILAEKFRPIIENSLGQVNATNIWSNTIGVYNNLPIPGKKPVNTDLTMFVTEKAMDGLFLMVEKKENEIREKVSSRTSGILKKVFGYADSFKTQ